MQSIIQEVLHGNKPKQEFLKTLRARLKRRNGKSLTRIHERSGINSMSRGTASSFHIRDIFDSPTSGDGKCQQKALDGNSCYESTRDESTQIDDQVSFHEDRCRMGRTAGVGVEQQRREDRQSAFWDSGGGVERSACRTTQYEVNSVHHKIISWKFEDLCSRPCGAAESVNVNIILRRCTATESREHNNFAICRKRIRCPNLMIWKLDSSIVNSKFHIAGDVFCKCESFLVCCSGRS